MILRRIVFHRFAALLPLALVACGPGARPEPIPAPPPVPAPAPAARASADWREWPLAPGRWRYKAGAPVSTARYVDGGAVSVVVRCDASRRQVAILRPGATREIEIITSNRTARFPAGHVEEGGVAMSGVILSAQDGFLDMMAFSRGRIALRSPGLPGLAVPAWAEPARVIEDCRK